MGCLLIVEQLALLVLVLAVVGTKDVHEVAQLVEARVDALPDALLERFPRLAFRAEAPGSAGARIVRRQQGGAAGVVADRDDLVEHALLELAVLAGCGTNSSTKRRARASARACSERYGR